MKLISIFSIFLVFAACSTTREVKEKFTVDLKSPQISTGTISAQFEGILSFGGLKRYDVNISYFPVEDAVCLQYKIDFVTYYQFWNKANRDAFVNALVKYNEDYEQRNLGRSGMRSKQSYGTVNGFLIWQIISFAKPASGNPDIDFGYLFKSNSPYFTVNQRTAYYLDPVSRQDNKQSTEICLYFTRAQADELAALFDQQFLNELSYSESNNTSRESYTEREIY